MQSFDRQGTCVGFCGPTEERIVIASFGHVDNRIDEAFACFNYTNAISETTAIADMSNDRQSDRAEKQVLLRTISSEDLILFSRLLNRSQNKLLFRFIKTR